MSRQFDLVRSSQVDGALSNRNRIINGAMVIDQRNAGAAVTPTAAGYSTVDRWRCTISAASKLSFQQSSTAPNNHNNSLEITSLSAYTAGSSDYFTLQQNMEGYNVADFGWGTSAAVDVTLSFWVRSSLTGTFGGCAQNSAGDRNYPFTYTINSADTWEQKSITILGDTSGTWLTTNGVGISLGFGLGVGSTFSGPAGAWSSTYYLSATGATSIVATNGATFYITGVQLEVGDTATPFEHRSYGQELALCERYYQLSGGLGRTNSTTGADIYSVFKTPMRVTPSATINDGTSSFAQFGIPQANINSISGTFMQTPYSVGCIIATSATGLTSGLVAATYGTAFAFDAEL